MILDIGPATVRRVAAVLEEARTLVWNGQLGAFETPPFDRGTLAVANKVGELTRAGKLLSVAGGGDTVAALAAAGVMHELSYVSTAGGAFLEWLEGRELPGVTALAPADQINEARTEVGQILAITRKSVMDPPDVMNSNVIFVERDTPVSDASGQLVWGRTSLWSHRRCSRRRVIAEGVCRGSPS
jgi:hypothetical protein